MPSSKFSLNYQLSEMLELIKPYSHQNLAIWAHDCALRVLPYFETSYPADTRPRTALTTLKQWIDTGDFHMSVIRGASLASHAAARKVGQDNSARSAARSAGQAVASAHVRTHSLAAANYALQAVFRAAAPGEADAAVVRERAWQLHRLAQLKDHLK